MMASFTRINIGEPCLPIVGGAVPDARARTLSRGPSPDAGGRTVRMRSWELVEP